ncbi:MAG: hypothetical protein MZV49_23670 [Rhodopseudomonas palustris]|nr:hypothetical protein [Rhodopseudomonas palustris]
MPALVRLNNFDGVTTDIEADGGFPEPPKISIFSLPGTDPDPAGSVIGRKMFATHLS